MQTKYREYVCLSKDAQVNQIQYRNNDHDLAVKLKECQNTLKDARSHLSRVIGDRDNLLNMSKELRAQIKNHAG
jgi:intergrase/recombinase